MYHTRSFFFPIVLGLLITNFCDAQGQTATKWSTTVKVSVIGSPSDDPLVSEIGSYVKRELRSLGDVTVVEDNPNWVLAINFVNLKSAITPAVDGIVINASLQRFIDSGSLLAFLRFSTRPAANGPATNLKMDEIVAVFKDSLQYATDARSSMESLLWGGLGDVPHLCTTIVTDADTRLFEPQRQAWNKSGKTQGR